MASYDLSYLDSNVGDASNTSGSSSSHSSPEKEESMHPPASDFKTPVEKDTTHHMKNTTLMHTVLPNSMLPREYGHSGLPVSSDTGIREHTKAVENMGEAFNQHDESSSSCSSSCCHSFEQFHGCQHDSRYAQPHTLPSADTYTTVSLSQSYSTMMWDDDDEEGYGSSGSDDYILSPVDSVFRKDEQMEEEDPPSCSPPPSFPTSAAIATKTHEAYQYLLRMKPQNYLHGSGSSEDMEYRDGELAESYGHSNRTNSILGSSSSTGVNQCGPLFLQ